MNIKRLEQLPEGCFGSYDSAALSEWEVKHLEKAGIVRGFYWYGSGSYEGAGQLLYQVKGDTRWYLHNMGHCSCYGPTDRLTGVPYESLEALEAACSPELRREVVELVKMARES